MFIAILSGFQKNLRNLISEFPASFLIDFIKILSVLDQQSASPDPCQQGSFFHKLLRL